MRIETCKRCLENWCYYGTGRPLRCGKCKSPYWDKERKADAPQFAEGFGHGKSVVAIATEEIPPEPKKRVAKGHDPKRCRIYGCLMCKEGK